MTRTGGLRRFTLPAKPDLLELHQDRDQEVVVGVKRLDIGRLPAGILQYLPVGLVVGFLFVAELVMVGAAWVIAPGMPQSISSPIPTTMTNTEALGRVLYTEYVYYFQAAGLVLLIAMIGAIVLTLRHKPNVKRQNIADQVARSPETAIEVVKVQSGQGLGA